MCYYPRQEPTSEEGGSSKGIQVESTLAGMRGGRRQDEEKKRLEASTIRSQRRQEGEYRVGRMSRECDFASGLKKRWDTCLDEHVAGDAGDHDRPALASGGNACSSDPGSIFADGLYQSSTSCRI